MADPWTTMARMYDHNAAVLRARAAGSLADAAMLLAEAERLDACATRQRELATMHGHGSARWAPSRPEPCL